MSASSVLSTSALEIAAGAGIGFTLEMIFGEAEKIQHDHKNTLTLSVEVLAQLLANGFLFSMWTDWARRNGIDTGVTQSFVMFMTQMMAQPNLRAKVGVLMDNWSGGFRKAFVGSEVPTLQRQDMPGFIPINTDPANPDVPDGNESMGLLDDY